MLGNCLIKRPNQVACLRSTRYIFILIFFPHEGGAHAVDSSDIAFRMAAIGAMRQGEAG